MKINFPPQITLSPRARKITLVLAVIFLIFSAGLFYVNKIFLPVQVKAIAIKAAQDALKRNVNFDTLQYSPLHGFVISGLVIAEKDDPSRAFFQASQVSAQVLFLALLQKKLILHAVRIDAPQVTLTRTGKDAWNFSDLLGAPPAGPEKPRPDMDVVISGFAVHNGRIILRDSFLDDNFEEAVNFPLIKGAFSLNGSFNLAGDIVIPSTQGALKFDTRIGMLDKSFRGSFKAKNITVSRYLRFAPAALPVDLRSLTLADGDITAMVQGGNAHITGSLDLPGLDVRMADGTRIQGSLLLTRIIAAVNATDISLQGTLLANTASLATAAGLKASAGSLRASGVQASVKDGLLSASLDVEIKEALLALDARQHMSGNFTLQSLSITQDARGYTITANPSAEGFSMTLAGDQTLTGSIVLKQASASITGTAMQARADIEFNNAAFTMPGASANAHVTAEGTQVSLDTGRLEASTRAVFRKLSVKSNGISATGEPELTARIILDPRAATPLTYAGTLTLPGFSASGLPAVGEVKDLRGDIAFTDQQAETRNLTLTVLGTPVILAGTVARFAAPRVDVTAQADAVNLALAGKFIPDIVKELGLDLTGSAAIKVHFSGSPAQPQEARITATARLTDAGIASRKLKQSVQAINGLVEYNAPVLAWKDLRADFQGKTWTSRGTLQDFANPSMKATLKTDELTADIEAARTGDQIRINAITGTYFGSNFNIKGTATTPAGQPPAVDLSSEFKLSLKDLPRMLPPEQRKQIEALQLAGILKIRASVKGAPQDWQNLASTISVETPAIYVMGYQMADLDLKAEQKDGRIDPLTINGKLYGGELRTTTAISLKDNGFPFDTALKLDNTSLELLKKDTPLKNQQVAGMLSATAQLKGALLDIRKVSGNAAVKIANGYLWDLEILSRVLSILSSSFQGGDVIITDASATFKITDEKVMTDDLALRSATVTLGGEGWVDFDQNIDLNISPRLEPQTSGNALSVINPTAGIVNIRVYNTLSAPKFEHNLSAPQMIKKTLQNTVGNILKLFE